MFEGLVFGWRTALLVPPLLTMLILSVALCRTMVNRTANRTLAVLLIVLAGTVTPWAIGFAGFYDRWQWLSFAPFSHPLAVAPLFYFYLHALVHARLPMRAMWHLAAPLAHAAFSLISFALPITAKLAWARQVSSVLDVVIAAGIAGGFAAYGAMSWKLLRQYRQWLASQRSDDNRFSARWVQHILFGAAGLMLVWSLFEISNAVVGLSYRGLMGLYVVISALGMALAIEGWRHAQMPFPVMAAPETVPVASTAGTAMDEAPSPSRDTVAEAERWVEAIRERRLFEDPELSLASAARQLATNQTYLSRAVNDGLGVNWSTLINGMRSEAVAERLSADPSSDILRTALDCGFNSKASFNRFFRNYHGMTPSAYRRQASQNP